MFTAGLSCKTVRLQRCAVLAAVLALHAALLAFWLLSSPRRPLAMAPVDPVELLLLSPPDNPQALMERGHPQRVPGVAALMLTPPPLMDVWPIPIPGSAADESTSKRAGQDSGVDWNAEAHRAVQAFAIRSHQSQNGASVSGLPGEDRWWPHASHHAGEQFKTPNGDWIVWVSPDCYQVATSAPNSSALAAAAPPTICRDKAGVPDAHSQHPGSRPHTEGPDAPGP